MGANMYETSYDEHRPFKLKFGRHYSSDVCAFHKTFVYLPKNNQYLLRCDNGRASLGSVDSLELVPLFLRLDSHGLSWN